MKVYTIVVTPLGKIVGKPTELTEVELKEKIDLFSDNLSKMIYLKVEGEDGNSTIIPQGVLQNSLIKFVGVV